MNPDKDGESKRTTINYSHSQCAICTLESKLKADLSLDSADYYNISLGCISLKYIFLKPSCVCFRRVYFILFNLEHYTHVAIFH